MGAESPSKCPTSLFTKFIPPAQLPRPLHPDPGWDKRLMAKWPPSQTKRSERSQAPQTAGTGGPVCSQPTGPSVGKDPLPEAKAEAQFQPALCSCLLRDSGLLLSSGLSFPVWSVKEQAPPRDFQVFSSSRSQE